MIRGEVVPDVWADPARRARLADRTSHAAIFITLRSAASQSMPHDLTVMVLEHLAEGIRAVDRRGVQVFLVEGNPVQVYGHAIGM